MNYFFSISRLYKRLISITADFLFISLAFIGAFYTRLGDLTLLKEPEYTHALLLLALSTLFLFARVGLYRAVLRYLSVHALFTIVLSCLASSVFLVMLGYFTDLFIPRSIPIIYCTFLLLLSGGARLLVRVSVSKQKSRKKERVVIYGAGDSGRQLLNLLRQGDELHPVAFVDDEKKLLKTVVNGLTVYANNDLESLIKHKRVGKILLAMPSVQRGARKSIIDSLVELPVEVLSIPRFEELLNGTATIDQLRDVPIEDLLGRDAIPAKPELLGANIKNKVVMVTGAGGSIGSELCRQILLQQPKTLILFELSEYALYQIEKELSGIDSLQQLDVEIVPLLGSVQRQNRLSAILKSFKVQTLYHAAAYKHVPLVEYNVVEGVRNNVFGTYFTALAAIEAQVESFVLISTDKAVRPTNVMGTTKRMAELSLQSLAAEDHNTRFCMVRFGNVLGSSGSVIPLFKRQISEGDHVTITHPDIIRYFMTIPEAAGLVIQAGAMGKGGDVFVLDMGEPVRIVDLAVNLIKLSGLEVKSAENPYGDIEIKYTGLRPGEKLFEELLIGDNVMGSEHERIMCANESFLPYSEYKLILDRLDVACDCFDHEKIREILLSVPAGFNPTDEIGDLVWKAKNNIKYKSDKIL
ncbi:nucleoside-diphosphate sugar epimerase [Psychromonas sp. psych-6C06]|uniref:polysaccharide biosynthesis protein n=1 Tax=Psychromonas sp. psych-6C06 TaxID=2058089 RepID=UPI000C33F860|nr:nucleoside-diphosphate sugar epimerase/dehydratase [Psychromonas sp. psych-6C06]PKF63055.1 nucleoside-diphosphate sugar epimerase [Psychromonas sp. psych-6C06]